MKYSHRIDDTALYVFIIFVSAGCCPPYGEEPVALEQIEKLIPLEQREESVVHEPLVIGKAHNPELPDRANFEATWATLSWTPGAGAVSHDVYLSDNFDAVNNGAGDAFRGNQSETRFIIGFMGFAYPNGLVPGKTYYWRIDEFNEGAANSPCRGDVWRFTVVEK